MRWEDFSIGEELGRGSFGVVYKANRRSDGLVCVVKLVDTKRLSPAARTEATNEVQLLKSLDHPHIVRYHGNFCDKRGLGIVMEYAARGDLSAKLRDVRDRRKHLSEDAIWRYARQIMSALGYIHGKNILHRDLKAMNIFLDAAGNVKLGDFGVSKVLEDSRELAHTRCGTPYTMSPELCESVPYSTKSDVWALGCVIYECCMLRPPFDAANLGALVFKIVSGRYVPVDSARYSESLSGLVKSCLTKDQHKRPSVADLIAVHNLSSHMNTGLAQPSALAQGTNITKAKPGPRYAWMADGVKRESAHRPKVKVKRPEAVAPASRAQRRPMAPHRWGAPARALTRHCVLSGDREGVKSPRVNQDVGNRQPNAAPNRQNNNCRQMNERKRREAEALAAVQKLAAARQHSLEKARARKPRRKPTARERHRHVARVRSSPARVNAQAVHSKAVARRGHLPQPSTAVPRQIGLRKASSPAGPRCRQIAGEGHIAISSSVAQQLDLVSVASTETKGVEEEFAVVQLQPSAQSMAEDTFEPLVKAEEEDEDYEESEQHQILIGANGQKQSGTTEPMRARVNSLHEAANGGAVVACASKMWAAPQLLSCSSQLRARMAALEESPCRWDEAITVEEC